VNLSQCPPYTSSYHPTKDDRAQELITFSSIPPILSAEDQKQYEQIPCPFCKSYAAKVFRQSADIVQCQKCSVVYLRTRLNDIALEKLYQGYAEEQSYMHLPKNLEEAKRCSVRRINNMKEMLQFIKPEGILLDVGCGWGPFLLTAQEFGFTPMGVELTKKSVQYANEVLKFSVASTQFLDTHYEPESISVVTMFHVLEHLTHPEEVFKKIYRILKPRGMFCGMVPNIESFYSTTLKEKWAWLDSSYHYMHYSPATLSKHLEASGLKIEHIYTRSRGYPDLRETVEALYPELKDNIRYKTWLRGQERSGHGEGIHFFARKPSHKSQ